jgi:SAM-dependent methyltransferase
MGRAIADIERMPRGGPNASCLDRRLQTGRLEYLDRDDVDPGVKRSVIRALERTGEIFGNTEKFARIALDEVADVPDPKILELGAGHGGLSARLLELHPTAQLTVTDVEPESAAAIAAGALGDDPRVIVREMDATDIDAEDRQFDLAVFALSFHHLHRFSRRGRSQKAPGRPTSCSSSTCPAHLRPCTCCGWRRCCPSRRSYRSCTTD